jgi:hypothetical protein
MYEVQGLQLDELVCDSPSTLTSALPNMLFWQTKGLRQPLCHSIQAAGTSFKEVAKLARNL